MSEPRWKPGQRGWEVHIKTPLGEWWVHPKVWETFRKAEGHARGMMDLPEYRIMPAIDPFYDAIEPKWLWAGLFSLAAVLIFIVSLISWLWY